jgi:hypothetical protein
MTPQEARRPRTEAGKRLLAEVSYDHDPENYYPGDYFERYRDAILAIEDEAATLALDDHDCKDSFTVPEQDVPASWSKR